MNIIKFPCKYSFSHILKIMFLLLIINHFQIFATDDFSRKFIHVGFFPFEGYHMMDENNVKSGYGYDLLQEMAVFGNWNYDYIGYNENLSWNDMLIMLEQGKIDMVTSATITDERLSKFLYTDIPIGVSSTKITVKAGNGKYDLDDYSAWNNVRVGMLKNNSRNKSFEHYAALHGFIYESVEVESQSELSEKLDFNEVDMIVTSNLLKIDNTWTLDQYDEKNFYIIVRKDKPELLQEVNQVLTQLKASSPDFAKDLYKKYYETNSSAMLSFTKAEMAYIDECNKSNKIFYAVLNPDRKPLSYYEDGQIKGLLFDICTKIFERSGLNIQIVPIQNRDEYLSQMYDESNAIICDFSDAFDKAEKMHYIKTSSYYAGSLSKLIRKNYDGKGNRKANIRNSITNTILNSLSENEVSFFYDNLESCKDAILKGEADYCLLYTRAALELLYFDQTNSLTCVSVPNLVVNFSIALSLNQSSYLASIIQKCVKSISSEDIWQFSEDYTYFESNKLSLTGFVYQYPFTVLFIIVLIFISIFCFAYFIVSEKRKKQMILANQKISDALEIAKSANSAKTDFFARMSHDIRTPMNAIIGLTTLTLDEPNLSESVKNNLSKINLSSEFLLGLVNDVLDMSKIERGEIKLNKYVYSYNEFLLNLKTLFEPMCISKNIKFNFKKIDGNFSIITDKVRLNQIFFNILSNAVKFTPEGGCITYKTENLKISKSQIEADYIIADTGIGISDDFKKHLFEPFQQENDEITSKLQGTGLGLSIAKKLIDIMGGTLRIESQKDIGTTVVIHLVLEIAQDVETPIEVKTEENINLSILKDKNILLVEDNPLNAEIGEQLLKKHKINVYKVENGLLAVNAFNNSDIGFFDAILMDIRMPVMDGLTATKEIRNLIKADAKLVPIIAMSANAYQEDVTQCIQAGMNAHLAKPIEPEKLFSFLAKYIKEYEKNF